MGGGAETGISLRPARAGHPGCGYDVWAAISDSYRQSLPRRTDPLLRELSPHSQLYGSGSISLRSFAHGIMDGKAIKRVAIERTA